MEKLTELLKMDEYGVFVWSAYGLATAVLATLYLLASRNLKTAQKQLEAHQNRHET